MDACSVQEEGSLGPTNGHIVGRVLKEAVRRAIVAARNERATFEAQIKESYGGSMDDVFTSADREAQDVYLRTFRECFPLCGVIAEEDSLRIDPQPGTNAYFTVDPIDGTKAYVRRQSHGISTMVALVENGVVTSAYIGDINTQEMYGYRPGSSKVHRITDLDMFEELGYVESLTEITETKEWHVLLRDPLERYSPSTIGVVSQLRGYEIMGSSIGTWFARLWKREVKAVFMPPSFETPWDSTPVIGISQKLGYVFLRPDSKGGWEEYQPVIPQKVSPCHHDTMVIHRNDLQQFLSRSAA